MLPSNTKLLRGLGVALTVLALGFVVWLYHATVRAHGGFQQPGEEDYYNFLVKGWRQGHLHLSKEPQPELLALADPYDPAQNGAVRMGDASYFQGHYYLYFGAAPALVLMLPYDVITGREMGTTTAVHVFCVMGFLATSGLWLAMRRRYFPASRWWVGPLGVVMLGLGTQVLILERRPFVWELPIAAGFAFSMLALVGIYAALHGRRPALAMGMAGLSLGLAVASRPTCLLGAVLFLPPLWWMWRNGPAKQAWRCGLGAAGGLGVCLVAVLAHNFARFGDVLEFGQNYQLSGVYEARMHHFSFSYVAHNLYIYYFHPGTWTWHFPFAGASAVRGGPTGYLGDWNDAVFALGVTFPFFWLALASPLAGWRRGGEEGARLAAMLGAVALFYLAMNAVISAYFLATSRYTVDFAPALGLLAGFGWLGLEEWTQRHGWRKLVMVLAIAACVATAIVGLLETEWVFGRPG